MAFHHVLAPVDFEPYSQRALNTAIDVACAFEARLTLVHAWDLPAAGYSGRFAPTPSMWAALAKGARQTLDSTMEGVRKRVPLAEAMLLQGSPATEILAAIEAAGADLVVLGTHGRHGLSRFLLGSVAEKVVRSSPVPVLTVRSAAPSQP